MHQFLACPSLMTLDVDKAMIIITREPGTRMRYMSRRYNVIAYLHAGEMYSREKERSGFAMEGKVAARWLCLGR